MDTHETIEEVLVTVFSLLSVWWLHGEQNEKVASRKDLSIEAVAGFVVENRYGTTTNKEYNRLIHSLYCSWKWNA
jgi:hypothetical protein